MIIVVAGAMAAGKSTVAQAIAMRLPRAVHVRGDIFRRMVVSGRAEMSTEPSDESLRQLELRYRLGRMVADEYARAGFTAVVQDVIYGPGLPDYVAGFATTPVALVMLAPRPDVLEKREADRDKSGYGAEWDAAAMNRELHETTPRIGLWLDTSDQSVAETVDEILGRLAEATVR